MRDKVANEEMERLRRRIAELEASEKRWSELSEQLSLFHKFVETSHEGLGWADLNGDVKYLNSALCRMLDLERPEDKYGEPVSQFYDEATRQRLAEEVFPEVVATGAWTGELDLHSVRGRCTPTLNSLFLLTDADGHPMCFANVVTDLTERKRAEEQLRQHRDRLEELVAARTGELSRTNEQLQLHIVERRRAEEERIRLEKKVHETQKLESLGILAGGIAHDFNNLLLGVLGNAELALMDLAPESPARFRVLDIVAAAKRLADLTNQMLAYSGKGRFVVEPINLSRLVEEMVHLLEVCISKKAVIKYDLMDSLPPTECDASQIRQVIMNLITNASEAIGEKSGVIALSTGIVFVDESYLDNVYPRTALPQGYYVFVEVSDTGCGMDRETIDKMFDPFFTTKSTGRGLGLAAALGIVRGHRGGIKIYSEPKRGTTAKVLLPQAREAKAPLKKEVPEAARLHGGEMVLVVDDEETVRAVAKMMLESAGFHVLLAADGREALQLVRVHQEELSAVLLDLTMPHMDGVETFGEIHRIRSDLPVILMSGYNEQDATRSFAGKGLADFIQKPFLVSPLIQKLRRLLGG